MPLKEKIDPSSAFIANLHIPEDNTAIDGVLPAEDLDMVVAKGVGKFEGRLMVQLGRLQGRTPIGIVYRPGAEYVGYRQGRERYIDPDYLKNGNTSSSYKRGLWVPIELLGSINHH